MTNQKMKNIFMCLAVVKAGREHKLLLYVIHGMKERNNSYSRDILCHSDSRSIIHGYTIHNQLGGKIFKMKKNSGRKELSE